MIRSVRRACHRRIRAFEVPADVRTIDALVDAVARRRGRPIRLHAMDLARSGVTGAWIPGASCDYVFYEVKTSVRHRAQIVAHELGHMICGHQPAVHAEADRRQLTMPVAAAHMLARDAYDDEQELAAEQTADLLLERLDGSGQRAGDVLSRFLEQRRD